MLRSPGEEAGGIACIVFGAIPLLWLVWLQSQRVKRGAEFWVLAVAMAVSVPADLLALAGRWFGFIPPAVPSNTYIFLQASLVGMALLPPARSALFAGVFLFAAVITAPMSTDLILFSVTGLAIAGLALFYHTAMPIPLRLFLVVAFGGGVLAWWVYCLLPGAWTYVGFQWVRSLGVALFCWAALKPGPALRLA